MSELALNPRQLEKLLATLIPAKEPVLIQGAPGVGKSDIVTQAATQAGADIIISHPVVSDPTDFKGLPGIVYDQPQPFGGINPHTSGQAHAEFLPFGELRQAVEADKPTVFFIDDIGQAPPAVQAAAMQLILARRVNGHRVSEHICFVAATNRRQDRAGVSGLLEPVKSRFSTIVELQPDLDSWCNWALSNNMPTELISFIRFRPNLLHDFKPSVDLNNSPCPRTVANVGRLLNLGIAGELEYPTIAGAAGEAFAAEFLGFLRICRNLPNIDQILLDPNAGEVPTDPATLYALCGALSRKTSDTTIDRVVTYCDRLPAEFSVLLMRDAVKLSPTVTSSRGFITWATKHSDLLI